VDARGNPEVTPAARCSSRPQGSAGRPSGPQPSPRSEHEVGPMGGPSLVQWSAIAGAAAASVAATNQARSPPAVQRTLAAPRASAVTAPAPAGCAATTPAAYGCSGLWSAGQLAAAAAPNPQMSPAPVYRQTCQTSPPSTPMQSQYRTVITTHHPGLFSSSVAAPTVSSSARTTKEIGISASAARSTDEGAPQPLVALRACRWSDPTGAPSAARRPRSIGPAPEPAPLVARAAAPGAAAAAVGVVSPVRQVARSQYIAPAGHAVHPPPAASAGQPPFAARVPFGGAATFVAQSPTRCGAARSISPSGAAAAAAATAAALAAPRGGLASPSSSAAIGGPGPVGASHHVVQPWK